ncbi:MAG: FAD-binding oxidoreductase [Actinomycetota bacterium]|nr:FAD-binding oxidoreductase [Actinomycetota bacterium]
MVSRRVHGLRGGDALRVAPHGGITGTATSSLWFEQAMAHESGSAQAEAELPASADVAVVGGGFTGLWTALALKRRRPSAEVVLLEADLCGSGASGRNGGFILTSWSKFSSLRTACGEADAIAYGRAVQDGVGAIARFCADHEIDALLRGEGWLWAATNDAQMDSWQKTVEQLDAAGARPFELVGAEAVQALTGSPVHRGGVVDPAAAVVQPALLARGLRRAAIAAGVIVCERTPVQTIEATVSPMLITARGRLRAERIVLATGAWAAAIPEVRRALVVIASDIVATEPIPDRLKELGWRRGLAISDSRRLVNYYRQSEDGRVVFGKGGGGVALHGQIRPGFLGASARARDITGQFHYVFPMLADVPAPRSWRGPVDYSINGLPFFAELPGRSGLIVGAGFSGSGVGPAYTAGDILAAIALGEDDHPGPEGLCRLPGGAMPPEPLRFAGGVAVRAAVARKEADEDGGRRAGRVTRALAALDPTSFVDRG